MPDDQTYNQKQVGAFLASARVSERLDIAFQIAIRDMRVAAEPPILIETLQEYYVALSTPAAPPVEPEKRDPTKPEKLDKPTKP